MIYGLFISFLIIFSCVLFDPIILFKANNVIAIYFFSMYVATLMLSCLFIYFFESSKKRKRMFFPHVMGRITSVSRVGALKNRFVIHYKYVVKDRNYNGDKFDFIQHKAKLSDVYSLHSDYLKIPEDQIDNSLDGKSIKIYYNPNNIWDSSLSRYKEVSFFTVSIPFMTVIILSIIAFLKIFGVSI